MSIFLPDNLDQIDQTFPYVPAMRACMQDPVHHAEGDVWTHTQMVLAALPQFQMDDRIGRLTALYHDVAKPATRTVEYDPVQDRDVVRHPYHARKGAAQAWYDLWLADEPLATRLAVYWLCRWHQRVFHIWDDADMTRAVLMFASLGRWSQLIGFARADNAGRTCPNAQATFDNLSLLEEWLAESAPSWESDHDRIFYFEKAGRSPLFHSQPPVGSRVTILCGLPGVGKDTYIKTHLADRPVVSLDAIRQTLDVAPDDNQGLVVQTAFAQARVLLRDRRPFVWNAQCGTRLTRGKIIDLCRAYDAHVSILAFDRPLPLILRQNAMRRRQVPETVIMAAARKWEPPTLLEAHTVDWV